MRAIFLDRVFIGGELNGAGEQLPCVFKSMHPFTERLEIPPFGGWPLLMKSLHSKIDRTKVPGRALEFEPGTVVDAAGKETTQLVSHSLDLASPRLRKRRVERECKCAVKTQGILQSPHDVLSAS